MIGTFRVGEDITLALDAVRGDVEDVTSIAVSMLLVYRENGPPKGNSVIPLVAEPRAAEGDIPAGWLCSIAAADTLTLPVGIYALGVQIEIDGEVEIPNTPAHIQLLANPFA